MKSDSEIRIVAKASVAGENMPLRVNAVPKALLQLVPGTEVRADIMGITDGGRTLVKIEGELLTMELPKSLTTGGTLQMTFLGREPCLAFSLPMQQSNAAPVSISWAGRWLSQVSGATTEMGELPRLARLAEGPLLDTARLTTALRQAVISSGIFYESHLAEWAAGKRAIADLFLEPQASLSSRLAEQSPQFVPSFSVAKIQESLPGNAAPDGQHGIQAAALVLPECICSEEMAQVPRGGLPAVTEKTVVPSTSAGPVAETAVTVQPDADTPTVSLRDSATAGMGLLREETAQGGCPVAGTAQAPAVAAMPQQKPSQEILQQVTPLSDQPVTSEGSRVLAATAGSIAPGSAVAKGKEKSRQVIPSGAEMEVSSLELSRHKGKKITATDEAVSALPSAVESVLADPRTISIVRDQLATLNSGIFVWHGEAWPGQKIDWRLEDREAQKQETTDGRWGSELMIDLPHLGKIVASLRIRGKELSLSLAADAERSAKLLRQELPTLEKRLASTGLSLKGSVIRHDKAE